jgi:peptidoglycan/LPS O-acetylase OafA/YrhL
VSWNSPRSSAARFYHPELDVLRFFAFFMVFLCHALPHEPSFYTGMGVAPRLASLLGAIGTAGAFGVPLFFLLSSYLITELLVRERDRFGHIDLKAFYIRRVLRIWPLYFCFLALAWSMQWYVPGQHIGWRAGLAFCLLGGNWWLVFVGFPSSVIFPLWSVSIEEQFYIFWPATMRKLSQRGMLIAAILMLVVANLTRWYLASRHTWESKIWANTFVQLDGIAFGILLTVFLAGAAPRIGPLPRIALFTGGLACFGLAANYFVINGDPLTMSRVLLGYPIMAIGAVGLFLATLRDPAPTAASAALPGRAPADGSAALPGRAPAAGSAALPVSGGPHLRQSADMYLRSSVRGSGSGSQAAVEVCESGGVAVADAPQPVGIRRSVRAWRIWESSALVYLGRISYGLYVFHVLALMISSYTVRRPDSTLGRFLLRDAIAFAITVALSAASYRWLESPFLTLKQRFTHVLSRPGG